MLGLGFDKFKSPRDRNILEITDFSRFKALMKLESDWVAKRMGSDSFTICGKRI